MRHTYILLCSDNSYYTGITTDLSRRIKEHNTSNQGAKYTRTRRPVVLAYSEQHTDRSSASQREYQIKQLTKKEKEKLTNKNPLD